MTFHRQIEHAIGAGAELLLDGHSTVVARGVAGDQIELMNYQHTPRDDGPQTYSPPVYAETYAEELRQRLPAVRVTVNASHWADGHYAIVMGYNKDVLFFEDPASFHATWLKEQEFLARWHDEDPVTGDKLLRFGMVLHGREPAARRMAHME